LPTAAEVAITSAEVRMGILADIFVAAPDDAVHYAELALEGELPADRFEYEQFGGFTQLELEVLWSMIDGLATLTAGNAKALSARWAAIEELRCAPEEVEPIVAALIRLAGIAKTNGCGLFLWGSL
jgi:hypothetical protein